MKSTLANYGYGAFLCVSIAVPYEQLLNDMVQILVI